MVLSSRRGNERWAKAILLPGRRPDRLNELWLLGESVSSASNGGACAEVPSATLAERSRRRGFAIQIASGSSAERLADLAFSWLFSSRRQALILLVNNGLRLCGLTFELSCPRRQAV